MKSVFLLATIIFLSSAAYPQIRVIYPEGVTIKNSPLPTFPAEAANLIYGAEVRVLVAVDAEGKVRGALAYGPLAPCSNLSDPVVESIRNEAMKAAAATTFEPIVKDGKAVEERVNIGYQLRSRETSADERRKIVSIGISNARATTFPAAEYPKAVKASGLKGSISVFVLIDESGNAISAGAFSGHPQFAEAGVKASCSARFPPMKLRNEPAKMLGILVYNFAP
jgi:outer membrane biosynthesis protein TonB